MSELFNNKYRIPSARLRSWNYASEGMYFVTICTKVCINYFGKIVENNGEAILEPTEIGMIACSEWYKAIQIRSDMNLELGEFVVMPNHIHGIIMIGKNEFNSNGGRGGDGGRDAMHRVCTAANDSAANAVANDSAANAAANDSAANAAANDSAANAAAANAAIGKFAPQSKNLASIMRGYKSAVTTYARKNNITFDWHPRFHDHIIRTDDAYQKISNYIIHNPAKWLADKFHQK